MNDWIDVYFPVSRPNLAAFDVLSITHQHAPPYHYLSTCHYQRSMFGEVGSTYVPSGGGGGGSTRSVRSCRPEPDCARRNQSVLRRPINERGCIPSTTEHSVGRARWLHVTRNTHGNFYDSL